MRVARVGLVMALALLPPTAASAGPTSGPGAGVPADPGADAVADPGATMRRIAARPFRYGGAVQGSVSGPVPGRFPGVPGAVDQPPLHLSIGLDPPASDGTLRGEAILFTADRHLVAAGPVTGRIAAGPTAGTRSCTLHLALPARPVSLSGLCSADTLSGEIVVHAPPGGLVARLATWWGDRDVSGRYWLTPASFDPGR